MPLTKPAFSFTKRGFEKKIHRSPPARDVVYV